MELALSWGGRSNGQILLASAGPGDTPDSDGVKTSQSASNSNRLISGRVNGTFGCQNLWELRLRRGMLNFMSSRCAGMVWLKKFASCLSWCLILELSGWACVVVVIVVFVVGDCVGLPECTPNVAASGPLMEMLLETALVTGRRRSTRWVLPNVLHDSDWARKSLERPTASISADGVPTTTDSS